MNIAIIGARGCIGRALIETLIDTTDHSIIASYRRQEKTGMPCARVTWKRVNLYDDLGTEEFLEGADVLVYLAHSLATKKFKEMDREFSERAGTFAKKAGIKKIVYLGGIVPNGEILSDHLESRKETGEELAAQGVPVAEVRASIILAPCSASYRMLYWLARRLPMVVMPKWGETTCAPIALEDAVDAIAAVIDRDIQGHEIFEIGSEIMQYGELLQRNGKIVRGKENRIYTMAWFPVSLVAWPISMITGVSRRIVAVLLGSLQNDSAYTANRFFELVGREPRPVDAALRDLAKEMEQW